MRNKFLLMGIAVIALVLSITVVGCKEEPDSPDPALIWNMGILDRILFIYI